MPIFPKLPPQQGGQSSHSSATPAQPNTSAQSPKQKQYIPQSARWRPTAEEQIEIEDLTYTLLASGLLKSQIKNQLKKWAQKKQKELASTQPGIQIEMDARTVERYLSRARARFVEESGKTKDELRTDSLNFYLAIARDLGADHRSRLQARERVDRLYGLDMPIKVAPTNPTGEQSYKQLTDQQVDARIFELITQAAEEQSARITGGTESPSGDASNG